MLPSMQVCCRRGLLLRPSAASVPVRSAFSFRQLPTMRPAAPAKKHGSAKRAKHNAGGRGLMSASAAAAAAAAALPLPPPLPADAKVPAPPPSDLDAHVAQAWEWWNSIGAPKYHVAPMVDQVRGDREREGQREMRQGCRIVDVVCWWRFFFPLPTTA